MISAPGKAELVTDTLDTDSLLTITAFTGRLCRVQLPDGSSGYIEEKQVELVGEAKEHGANPGSML